MEKKKIHYGWYIVIGCLLITCTMVPPIMALSNKFLIQVTEELGLSRSGFTLANTILQGLGIFISPMVSSRLAKGDMRKIQCISIIGFALSYASYSLAQNAIHLYIFSVFIGVFWLNSALIPVSMMITNWFAKKRGLAMSIAMAGIGVGGTIFSPIVTMLLEKYGWRHTYQIMALIVLVIALPAAFFILRKRPEDMGLKPYGSDEADTKTADKSSDKKESDLSLEVQQCWPKFFFWLMLIGMLCNGLINSGSLGQFPPAIEEMHGPAIQAAIISIYSMVGIFGKIVLGWLNDRFGVVVSTVCGCVAFAVSFIFMLMGSNVTMLYIMAVLFGLGDAIGTVTPPLVTAAVFGTKKYGQAYGIANSFTQVGLTCGSLMVAAIYDGTGAYTSAWILLFILTIVTLVGWIGSYALSRKYVEK